MQKPLVSATSLGSKSPLAPPAISYRLSDKKFLDLGWTSRAPVSSVYHIVLMRAKFSHSVISPWFRPRDEDLIMRYPDGSPLCISRKDATGNIFYPNGKLAIKVERGGRYNERTRIWVYSSGEVDHNGLKYSSRLCGLFDSVGNGVVYDAHMNKRLTYNQNEVVLWDSPVGQPLIYKWHNILFRGSIVTMNEEDARTHIINDPPKQIMWLPLPKFSSEKDPKKSVSFTSEELSKSEYEFREAAEHSRYLDTGKKYPRNVSPVKPIVLRINKHVALRIFSQSEISLSFFTNTNHTTLKIGILYNPFDKLKVVAVDASNEKEKSLCTFETLPAKTISMMQFKRILQKYRTSIKQA